MPMPPAERDAPRARILRIITRLNIGGPAIQAMTLSTRLEASGFDTTLVHGRLGPGEGDMRTLLPSPHDAEYIPSLRRPIDPLSDAITFGRLLTLMRRIRPAIVHTHMAKAGAIGRLAAMAYNAGPGRRRPARLVHTYHGHVLEGYFSPRATSVFLQLERQLARRTDALVAVSPAVRRELLEDFQIGDGARFHVIPLGFNLDALAAIDDAARARARVDLDIAPGAPVVTWVGRLTAVKQPQVFVDLARLVAKAWPQAIFLLVGDGELRRDVEASIRRLGLSERIRLLGWRGDLARIYAATDVFALTSRNEGTPVALIEAMAAGLPTVSPDVGGIRDVVVDRNLGIVVPAATGERLAAAVCSLLETPAAGREAGKRARQSVLPRFGFERLVMDITALYRNLSDDPTRPIPGRAA
jgi:glycosyltransferase involved in cell wall biosynthesis